MLERRRLLSTAAAASVLAAAGATTGAAGQAHAAGGTPLQATAAMSGGYPGTLGHLYRPSADRLLPAAELAPQGVTFSSSPPAFNAARGVTWQNAASVARLNGALSLNSLDNGFSGANVMEGTTARGAYDLEFWHEGQRVAFMVAAYQGSDWQVHVDDQPVTADPQPIQSTGVGFIDIPFPAPKLRRIRVTLGYSDLVQILVERYDTMYPAEQRLNLGVLGDSWIYGSNGYLAGAIPQWISAATGFAVWRNGQGGTGYHNVTVPGLGFTPFGSTERVAALAKQPLDALLICGSINDFGQSPATVQSDAAACFQAIAAALPSLPVIVAGVQPCRNGDPALDAINTAVISAAKAAANVRLVIDWRNGDGSGPWITGTGTVAAPTGDGTGDVMIHAKDNPHPTLRANKLLGRRLATAMAGLAL